MKVLYMPTRDGTGPFGEGEMTGRGLGIRRMGRFPSKGRRRNFR
jgi:hypothetical protein